MQTDSRGWFESDEMFAARVKLSQSAPAKSKAAQSSAKAPAPAKAARSLPSTTNWVTPQTKKQPASNAKATKKPATGGSVFAAMMDSDSD
jgi:hypothetical protein